MGSFHLFHSENSSTQRRKNKEEEVKMRIEREERRTVMGGEESLGL